MNQEVITFGCRLNSFESEIIRSNLKTSGLKDVVVFNTCAVTKEAERQARQAIRKYKRNNPQAKIIVTGCGAQINPDQYAEIEGVDKIIGNEEKLAKETFTTPNFFANDEKILVNDIMSVKDTAVHMVDGFEERSRAFLQVQNGCNHRCTFCIIPYGRGNSRSVPMGEIVKHSKHLVEQGYNEIVLTGVDMTGYGSDLPDTPRLGEMMKRLLTNVPDLARLRLSSIDVAEIDDTLLDLIINEPRLMPHLHLSLQSGDNMILKRMKRRHTREQALEFCDKVRAVREDIVFGADIITGFPTESDQMFQNSFDLIKDTGIIYTHIFPYSEREGTPAARIPADKQVPVPIRKERTKILNALGKEQLNEFLKTRIGKTESVIIEKNGIARTEQFAMVKFETDQPQGSIAEITIAGVDDSKLISK